VYACTNSLSVSEFGSAKFSKFYHLLGDKVRLKGWEKFRGGLDTKSRPHMHVRVQTHAVARAHMYTCTHISHTHIFVIVSLFFIS